MTAITNSWLCTAKFRVAVEFLHNVTSPPKLINNLDFSERLPKPESGLIILIFFRCVPPISPHVDDLNTRAFLSLRAMTV